MSWQNTHPAESQATDRRGSALTGLVKRHRAFFQRFIKFGFVGSSGFLVDIGIYTLLTSILNTPHLFARAASYWVSATWNWFWNRQLTFSHVPKAKKLAQWSKYLGMCLVSFFPNWGTYCLLTTCVPFFTDHKQLALIAGVGCGMVFNFTIASLFIFTHREQEADKAR
ncbi:GtrA family protein [Candidatus Sororendozoicomonas aggregata]|uniref:GtrA family protein n=1 Tax=Candidatus Sororendozoicomonas aggregata TaxID=3073239 RepID=UPI002ED635B2